MFHCKYCGFKTLGLEAYLTHQSKSHRHVSRNINCGFRQCSKMVKTESHLKKHLLTNHGLRRRKRNFDRVIHPNERGKFICDLDLCRQECDTFSELIKHLKSHLAKNIEINCPVVGCRKKYKLKSSFTSHLSKNHRQSPDRVGDDHFDSTNVDQIQNEESFQGPHEPEDFANAENNILDSDRFQNLDYQEENADESDLFLRNVAQFYLKLETECHIPAKTVELIVSEITRLHGESQDILRNKLNQKFSEENIQSERVLEIFNQVFNQDPLKGCYKHLKTDYLTKKFYKTRFSYVEPQFIDINSTNKTFFAYIPIIETLNLVSRDLSVRDDLHKTRKPSREGYFQSFRDGNYFKNNQFFKETPEALKIILYQDEFEVVNPIGPAKRRHKLLAVYLNLADLSDHLQSHTNTMKLVALCKSRDFDHKAVYSHIVEDLKKLEFGVQIDGRILKGALVWISGDNLGSHGLGGFIENFSTVKYLCRFCLIKRNQFGERGGILKNYTWRTVNSYQNAVEHVSNNDVDSHEGVKFDSVFNELDNYHVCTGLPPCLGHDVFEGVVAYDLMLFVNYFIAKKWITLKDLNERIDAFPYSAEERSDKPCAFQKSTEKIVGGACQIWNFLRILPLLMADKIQDYEDDVWKCLLLLGEIVEIICSSSIHESCIPYLDTLIDEYLYMRELLFPASKLRPKHHYLKHYPRLIRLFGPLIKVWTLRYESKHRFFKRTIRTKQNFKNVVKTASEKHELFQSLVRLGSDARVEMDLGEIEYFNMNLYHHDIVNALENSSLSENVQECSKLIYRGTDFKKGYVLAIRHENYQESVTLGRICKILSQDLVQVYLLVEVLESEFIPYLRAYKIYGSRFYECVHLQNLIYHKPMPVYKWKNSNLVKPKYGLVCQPLQSECEDIVQDSSMPFFDVKLSNTSTSKIVKVESVEEVKTEAKKKFQLPYDVEEYHMVLEEGHADVDSDVILLASFNVARPLKAIIFHKTQQLCIEPPKHGDPTNTGISVPANPGNTLPTNNQNRGFNINTGVLQKLIEDILGKFEGGEKLEVDERKTLRRKIREYMFELNDVSNGMMTRIAQALIDKHPRTFEIKSEDNEYIDDGLKTLVTSISNGLQYFKGVQKAKNKRVSGNKDNEGASDPKKRERPIDRSVHVDEYGCVAYAPQLDDSENEQTQEKARLDLLQLFEDQNAHAADDVPRLMSQTYPTQRAFINADDRKLESVFTLFPFLKIPQQFYRHASELLEKDVVGIWNSLLKKYAESIKQKILKKIQDKKQKKQNESLKIHLDEMERAIERDKKVTPKYSVIIPLVILHFKDDASRLYKVIDEDSEDGELINEVDSSYPTLIIQGFDIHDVKGKYTVFIGKENRIICGDFLEGILITYLSYYVFGYAYRLNVEKTLEYIQRNLLAIHPPEGTKYPKKDKHPPPKFCPEVLKLMNEVIQHADNLILRDASQMSANDDPKLHS